MSYEIIYDKQFIRVSEDKFVPMILTGSNNCYDYNNRRARSWWAYNINNKVVLTQNEMVEYAKSVRQGIIDRNNSRERDEWYEAYDDKSFGYWSSIAINGSTRNTTYGQFEGIFKTGCSKSLTIEQLIDENVSVVVENTYYTSKMQEEYGIEPFSRVVTSGQELIDAISECNELFKDTPIQATVNFGYMSEEKPKYLRRKYFSKPRKEKERIGAGPELLEAVDLPSAVKAAHRYTPPGGIVLPSPAAPSYGIFDSFEERGRVFRKSIFQQWITRSGKKLL